MNELPSDGATTRLHRLFLLVEHCAAFSDGCSETQLIKYGLGLGLIASTILRYLSDLGPKGLDLITRNGSRYYVTDENYIIWAETKGFREKVYLFKCKNEECAAAFPSNLKECPSCKTINPLLNELRGYTHTPDDLTLNLKNENPIELTTEPETHTYKKTNDQETKENRVKEGREAEKRVVNLLRIFGAALLGKGRGGEPDVFFTSLLTKNKYCVEVKSVEHQVRSKGDSVNGYKVGVVSLSRGQWVSLCGFGEANGMVPLMIVEVKIRGSQNLYHFIRGNQVDYKLYSTDAKHIRISVHDLPIMSVHSYREGVPLVGEFRL